MRQGRRATALGKGENADDANAAALREGQGIAGLDSVAGLQAGLGIEAQVAGGDNRGGEAAGFAEAGVDEKEVEAVGGHLAKIEGVSYVDALFVKAVAEVVVGGDDANLLV